MDPDPAIILKTIPDKHRHFTVMSDGGYYRFNYHGRGSLTDKPVVIDPYDWDVDAGYAIYVSPPDLSKPALMPALERIEAEVCRTLKLFEAEF